jgi:hypothetical protein
MTSTTGPRPVLTLTSSRSDEPTGRPSPPAARLPRHPKRPAPTPGHGHSTRASGRRGHHATLVAYRRAMTWVSASAAKPVFPRPYRSGGRTGVAPLESTSLMLDLTSESLLSPKFSTSGGGGEHEAE